MKFEYPHEMHRLECLYVRYISIVYLPTSKLYEIPNIHPFKYYHHLFVHAVILK